MPTAYSYIRFSSAIQQKGDSLRRQTLLREEYLAEHPELELDTTLDMTDLGISAYDKSNITKGTLGVFLTAVKEGKVKEGSYFLVESLDRLSRAQVLDALELFLSIVNAGITIVSLADKMEYSKEEVNKNFSNLIVSIAVMSRAADESATKSKRIRSSWDSKRANIENKMLTSRCPYWMKLKDDKSGFELIPERVKVVKEIFKMSKDGIGNGEIVKRFNEGKVDTFSSRTNGWHISYIQKILTSKAVYGEFQMRLQRDGNITNFEKPISNYFPAIMSKQEWLLITSIRQERRTRGGVSKGKNLSNIFSGLLRCGYCKGSMVMGGHVKNRPDGSKYATKYVACSNARRGLGCTFVQWQYADLERELLDFCRGVDFAAVLKNGCGKAEEVEEAKKNLINIEIELTKQQEKLNNLLESLENSDKSPKIVVNRIAELEDNISNIEDERNAAESFVAGLESDIATHEFQQNSIIEIVNKLAILEGSELHDFRVRLSQRIKRAIKEVYLFPYGCWVSDSERIMLAEELKKINFSKLRIQKYFDDMNSHAKKDNRFMIITFKNGEILSVGGTYISQNFIIQNLEEYKKLNLRVC